jgi:hypothetical protein
VAKIDERREYLRKGILLSSLLSSVYQSHFYNGGVLLLPPPLFAPPFASAQTVVRLVCLVLPDFQNGRQLLDKGETLSCSMGLRGSEGVFLGMSGLGSYRK